MPALTFRPKHRLTHARQFQAVYAERCKAARGPMVLYAKRNELPHHRLGLSIGRRVGSAVVRNRFKRLIRESFRLAHANLPRWEGGSFDFVVALHPHEERPQAEYQRTLVELAEQLAQRKSRKPFAQDQPKDAGA